MKKREMFSLMAVICFWCACATSQEPLYTVNYDYDVSVDFTRLKTYAWEDPTKLRKDKPFAVACVMQAVDNTLSTRGFQVGTVSPDFLISMFGFTAETTDPNDWWGRLNTIEQGLIRLTVVDAKTKTTIWWGEAEARLDPDMTRTEKNAIINAAVQKIMENFPPAAYCP
nr:DUF4136 domain-containing protein [Deltaproteobacteria bacterium]